MPHGTMQCQIIHIDRFSSFKWEIPGFPVLKLELDRVLFKIGTEISDGVIQKKEAANIQKGNFICTSHCGIRVHDKNYTCFGNFNPQKEARHQSLITSQRTHMYIGLMMAGTHMREMI